MSAVKGERKSWDQRFMELARSVATWSKDNSTIVGCVIVGPDQEVRSLGYNGFPRGVDDNVEKRRERPEKYFWTEHAERNAIFNAARMGTALKGCRAYVSCMFICMDCARALAQAGIAEIICDEPADDPELALRWAEDIKRSTELFHEAGVIVRRAREFA
jgi:dCMP deaminase